MCFLFTQTKSSVLKCELVFVKFSYFVKKSTPDTFITNIIASSLSHNTSHKRHGTSYPICSANIAAISRRHHKTTRNDIQHTIKLQLCKLSKTLYYPFLNFVVQAVKNAYVGEKRVTKCKVVRL